MIIHNHNVCLQEAEVLWNPFEDIVPRTDLRAKRREEEARKWVARLTLPVMPACQSAHEHVLGEP